MATIALYASKINDMSGYLREAKGAVKSLKDDLSSLARKCGQVASDICNLEDVVETVSAATRLQESKFDALEDLKEDIAEFAEETARTDRKVAETVERNKDNFYKEYAYLKPDCEKNFWEKLCDACQSVSQWCAENWEALLVLVGTVIAVIAIIALSIVTFGAATVLVAALVGALVGVAGQLISDVITFARTGKWEGGLADYLGAAIGGAVNGVLMLSGNVALACAADAAISSLMTDSLTSLFGGERKSLGQMLVGAGFDAAVGAFTGVLFKKLTDKLVQFVPDNLTCLKRLSGKGSYEASYKMVLTKLSRGIINKISVKTIRNGLVSGIVGDLIKNTLDGLGILDIPTTLAQQSPLPQGIDWLLEKIRMKKQIHWAAVSLVTGMPQLTVLGILPTAWLFGGAA